MVKRTLSKSFKKSTRTKKSTKLSTRKVHRFIYKSCNVSCRVFAMNNDGTYAEFRALPVIFFDIPEDVITLPTPALGKSPLRFIEQTTGVNDLEGFKRRMHLYVNAINDRVSKLVIIHDTSRYEFTRSGIPFLKLVEEGYATIALVIELGAAPLFRAQKEIMIRDIGTFDLRLAPYIRKGYNIKKFGYTHRMTTFSELLHNKSMKSTVQRPGRRQARNQMVLPRSGRTYAKAQQITEAELIAILEDFDGAAELNAI